jgi:hypothetical protein
MGNIPVAKTIKTSYENFIAECPFCEKKNTFNRASDLKTFEPIAGRDVSCQNENCRKAFRIACDSINCAHEMFIMDCYELLELKHYMNCILSLAQAYEVFFSLFFRVELLYKPFGADPDLVKLKQLSEELHEKMKKNTFCPMRALFLQQMITGCSPENLAEAAMMIAALPDKPQDPKDESIKNLGNIKLVPLLKALKNTKIHELRNRVVHKQAFRPTRGEVEAALGEARSILFPLTNQLQLRDEINWYTRGKP